jgi:hypothetical protein
MVSPGAFELLRLISNSKVAASCTDCSPGTAPFKILSTYSTARRNKSSKLVASGWGWAECQGASQGLMETLIAGRSEWRSPANVVIASTTCSSLNS